MSTPRHCDIFQATNESWYLELADYRDQPDDEIPTYGPFATADAAEASLRHFSNPGSLWRDPNRRPVPVETRRPR